MAGQDKILWSLSLEGAEDVSKKLKGAGDVGDAQAKRLKQAFSDLGAGSRGSQGNNLLGDGAEAGASGANRLREAIHVLHPILEEAGLGLGNLGAFARLAGAGMGALATAIVGSLLVGLAKLGEEADKTKRRLDLLSGAGKGGGESQFEALQKTARNLGVDSSDLAPLSETLFRSQQNSRAADRTIVPAPNFVPGPIQEAANRVQIFRRGDATPSAGLSAETINAAVRAAVEAGRLDRTSTKDSAAALANLVDSTKGGKGQISVEAFDALAKSVPAVADALAKAVSGSGAGGIGQALPQGAPDLRAFLQRGGKLTGDQALTGLARTEPELRQQAEAVPPGVTESLEHLEAAAKRAAEALSGDLGMAAAIDKIAKLIDGVADHADRILHPKDFEPGGSKFIGPVRPEDKQAAPESLAEVFKSDKGDLLGRLVGFIRGGAQSPSFGGSNPFGTITDFSTKALTNPGELQEKTRPEAPQAPDEVTNGPRSEAADQTIKVADLGTAAEETAGKLRGLEPTAAAERPIDQPDVSHRAKPSEFEPVPPPKQEFEYIPPPKNEFQYIPPPEQRPQYIPPPAQPRSELEPTQVASLGSQFQSLIETISGALNNAGAKNLDQGGQPTGNLGIRGEVDSGATAKIADLGVAAEDAAAKLRGLEPSAPTAHAAEGGRVIRMAGGGQARLDVSPGGHLSGPGTGKSDSIPADVANGEFVINAEDTSNNLQILHDINSGKVKDGHYVNGGEVRSPTQERNGKTHFASGGEAGSPSNTNDPTGGLRGDVSVTYDPNTGGAYINDVLHLPGDPLLDVPVIKRLIQESKAGMNAPESKRKHKSDFVGLFGGHEFGDSGSYAAGGLVGSSGQSARHFAEGGMAAGASAVAAHFSAMGLDNVIHLPHLADGGMPDFAAADLNQSPLQPANSNGIDLQHFGSVDVRSGLGEHRMITHEDTMRHLNTAAIEAQTFATGKSPRWRGGRG